MKPKTWRELLDYFQSFLPDRPYQEALDLGAMSTWWRDVAVEMANAWLEERNVK